MSYNIDKEAGKVIKILKQEKRNIKDNSFILNFLERVENSGIDKDTKKEKSKKLKYPKLNELFNGTYDDKLVNFFYDRINLNSIKSIILNCFAMYGTKNLQDKIATIEYQHGVQVQNNNINTNDNDNNEQTEEETRNELDAMANDLVTTSQEQFNQRENRLEVAQNERSSIVEQVIQVNNDNGRTGSVIKVANNNNIFMTVETEASVFGRSPTMIEQENNVVREYLQERQRQLGNLNNDVSEQLNPSKVQNSK